MILMPELRGHEDKDACHSREPEMSQNHLLNISRSIATSRLVQIGCLLSLAISYASERDSRRRLDDDTERPAKSIRLERLQSLGVAARAEAPESPARLERLGLGSSHQSYLDYLKSIKDE